MQIMDSDKKARTLTEIKDLRVLPEAGDSLLVRFCVEVCESASEKTCKQPDVALIDQDGRNLALCNPILIGEGSQGIPGGFLRRSYLYSSRIKRGPEFAVVASNPNGVESLASLHVSHDEIRKQCNTWWEFATPAELNCDYDRQFRKKRLTVADEALQRIAQTNFRLRPLFSIVVPLYNTPTGFFREMVDSVLGQTYPNFELILVNSTPENEGLVSECSALESKDSRVRVVTLEGNRGITENTNAGIDVARGDFVSFFDHDDLLEPDCLYWYVKGINDYPTTDLLYCDEDKLEDGKYGFPFFKPDFDGLFLETNNYVCHLLTVRRSLLEDLPRPTSELDGAQDHSMALAAGERARNIYHVRRVLYHWRIHSLSTAGDVSVKPESLDAGKLAVDRHFERVGVCAHAENVSGMPHYYCAAPQFVESNNVSVLCYGSNESLKDSLLMVSAEVAWPGVEFLRVLTSENGLIGELLDVARTARGSYLALVGSDVRALSEDWLSVLLGVCSRDGVGIAAPVVLYPDGTVRDAGVVCSLEGVLRPILRDVNFESTPQIRGLLRCTHTVSAARGNCMLIRKDLFCQIAERLIDCPGLFWDVALCLEARLAFGLATVIVPAALMEAPVQPSVFSQNHDAVMRKFIAGRSWLLRRWPGAFSGVDRFYSRQFRQDGYYGLPDYK